MLFSKLTTIILYTICLFIVFVPVTYSSPSFENSLVLSDSLNVNESSLIKKIKDSFNSHEISGTEILGDLTDLNYSLNYKYSLINELIGSQFENDETLFILDGFINHILTYEYRFKKSLPPYAYNIYKKNISRIFFYMGKICDKQDYEKYLIQSVSYDPDEHNISLLAEYYSQLHRYIDALSLFIKGMWIDNSILMREKAEKCYVELYHNSIPFDQYIESLSKQKIDLYVETIEIPKRNDRLKALNNYGFGKKFYREKGLLLITCNDQNSNYLINSFHELSQRAGFVFHAIIISNDDRAVDNKELDYVSIFPELYQADIWNDFKLNEIPTLLFLAKRQKELIRISSYNRELPSIVEEVLKKDILTEF